MLKTVTCACVFALAGTSLAAAQATIGDHGPSNSRVVSPAKDGPAASSGQPGTNEYGRGEAASGFQPSTPPGGAGDAGAPNRRF